jgi:hypothetical protein
MRHSKRIAAGVASLALTVGAGAGLAEAAQQGGDRPASDGGGPGRGHFPGSAAIAEYLGLTAAELRARLDDGKSLADVARAEGKSISGLEDAIVADAKKLLAAAVADGRLTSPQASAGLEHLESRVDEMVNAAGVPFGPRGPGPGPLDLGAVSAYLGLTTAELRAQLEAGKSLADVARAEGKSVSGLEDAIVAAAKKRLDAAVADGKLTAARAKSMLDDLAERVGEMVNRSGPPPGGPHGRGPAPADSAGIGTFGVRL